MARKLAQKKPDTLYYEAMEERVLFSADAAPGLDLHLIDGQALVDDAVPHTASVDPNDLSAAVVQTSTDPQRELVIVNPNVDDYEQLVSDLQRNDPNRIIEVAVLDPQQDGIAQVTDLLAARSDLSAIHFITHGADGQIDLGDGWLNTTTLQQNADQVATWGQALTDSGDILFYGCNVAADGQGESLVDDIAWLTGADVAASDDLTGNASKGGDWDLEYQIGEIDSSPAADRLSHSSWSQTLATIAVTTTADENNGDTSNLSALQSTPGGTGISLREAIIAANNTAGADTITLGAGTYTLSIAGAWEQDAATGDLDILSDITITGNGIGQTIIDANGIDRVFEVGIDGVLPDPDIPGSLTLSGLEVTGGSINGAGGAIYIASVGTASIDQVDVHDNQTSGNAGGGVYNLGNFSATDSLIRNNLISGFNGGGGLYNGGTASLERVSIVGNTAGAGGGIAQSNGSLSLTNVTVSGNSVSGDGAGIQISGGTYSIDFATIANNDATSNGFGGGIDYGAGSGSIANSIIADNSARWSGNDVHGALTSGGNNVVEDYDISTFTPAGTDQTGSDPGLAALAMDAGSGQYFHAITDTSIAYDAASTSSPPATDQLGVTRDANPDIGAYEYALPNNAPAGADNTVTTSEDTAYTFKTSDFGFSDVDGHSLLQVWITTLPGQGQLKYKGATFAAGNYVYVDDIIAGQLTYEPAANANGTGYTSFTFQVQDDGGTANGGIDIDPSPNTITIDVTAANDAPMAADNTVTTAEDTPYTFGVGDFGFSDVDTGDSLSAVRIDALPAAGALSLNSVAISAGQVIAAADITAGNLVFAPAADANGAGYASFSFSVRDQANAYDSSPNTLTIDVTPVDDAPTDITPNGFSIDENTDTSAGVSLGTLSTTDPDSGDSFTYTIVGGADAVKFSIGGAGTDELILTDGVLDYESQSSYSVTVRTTDSGGNTYDETLTITVNDLNDAPTDISLTSASVNQSAGTNAVVGSLTTSDADTGDSHTYTLVAGTGATDNAAFNISGSQLRANDAGALAAGSYSVRIQTDDGNGGTYQEAFTITVVDDVAPGTPTDGDAAADSVTEGAATGTAVGLTAQSSDSPASAISYALTDDAGGRFQIDGATGVVTVADDTLIDYETGTSHNITVRATDAAGNTSSQTFTINVANAAPIAIDDGAGTDEDTVLNVGAGAGVLANDTDPNGFNGSAAVSAVAGAGGNVGAAVAGSNGGSFTVNADGSFGFDPGTDFQDLAAGDSRDTSVAYTLTDGTATATASLTVTVSGVNHAPVLTPPGVGFTTITEDDTGNTGDLVSTIVGASISDADSGDGQGIAISAVDSGNGTWQYSTDGGGSWFDVGAVSDNSALLLRDIDRIRFVPDTVDADTAGITFRAWDQTSGSAGNKVDAGTNGGATAFSSATATAGITVTAINDIPVITVDSTALVYGSGAIEIDPNLTLSDIDDTTLVSARVWFGDGHLPFEDRMVFADQSGITGSFNAFTGVLTLTGTATVTEYETALRSVQYRDLLASPTLGTLHVNFSVNDGTVDSAVDSRVIELINGTAPRASDDSGTVAEGGALTIDLAANDSDDNNLLDLGSITIKSGPAHGSLLVNGDGTVTYTHDGSETVSDSFTYSIKDQDTLESNTASVALTVTPVNDAPVITSDGGGATAGVNAAENQSAVTTVTATDADGDTPTFGISGGADAALFGIDTNTGVLSFNAAPDYENPTDGNADGVYEVQVTASDGNGGTASQAISVTVTDVNDAPVITSAAAVNAAENQSAATTVTATDADGDTPAFSINGGADAALFGIDTNTGVLTFNAAPDYENPADGNADGVYEVQVTASDGNGGSDNQLISVTVIDGNDAPTDISLSSASVNQSGGTNAVVGALTTADADTADTHTYTLVAGTGSTDNGSFNISGSQLRANDPGALAAGSYSVRIQTDDGNGGTYQEAFTITVVDDVAPGTPTDANAAADSVAEGAAAGTAVGLTAQSSDSPASAISYDLTDDAGGRFQIDGATGVVTVADDTLIDYEAGTSHNITVRATDAAGNQSTQTFTITVTNVAPTTVDDSATTGENTVLNVAAGAGVLTNDTDPNGFNGSAAVSAVAGAGGNVGAAVAGSNGGSFTVNADGSFDFDPGADFDDLAAGDSRVTSVAYTLTDGAATGTATLTVTVDGANDAPLIGGDTGGGVTEDGTLTATGALTISDADTGEAVFTAQSAAASASGYGTVELDAAGNWTYTLDNANATVQSLSAGQTLADSFTAVSADGSTQVVTLTITGADDGAGGSTGTIADPGEDSGTDDPGSGDINDPYPQVPTDDTPFAYEPIEITIDPVQERPDDGGVFVSQPFSNTDVSQKFDGSTDANDAGDAGRRDDHDDRVYWEDDRLRELYFSKHTSFKTAGNVPVVDSQIDFSKIDLDSQASQRLDMQGAYDLFRDQLDQAFGDEKKSLSFRSKMAFIATATLTTGVVTYLLRASSLLTSLLFSLPAWHRFDPIAVFAGKRKKRKDADKSPDADQTQSEVFFEDGAK